MAPDRAPPGAAPVTSDAASAPTVAARPPSAHRAPAAPATIGRFEVVGKLGQGGMGVVFRGRDRALDRDLALKLVSPGDGGDGRLRLLREAQAMARVAHPNVVPVFEVGVHDDQVFVAMELVRGETLTAWLRSAARSWRDVLRVLVDAGRGLAAAHRAGVLHRDVKPDNLLIGDDGRARIADFGLARAATAAAAVSALALDLTHDGAVVGSPGFMSPEHFTGEVTAAADQWSLAATAYYALFGRLPFAARDLRVLQAMILTDPPAAPPPTDVPRAAVDAVLRGLARDPADRFATVDELVDALAAVLAVDPARDQTRFRRQRRGLAVAMATAGLLAFVLAGVRSGFTYDLGMRWHTGQSLIALAVVTAVSLGFRRALWGTTHDRRVMALILIALATIAAHRLVADAGGVDLVVMLRTDALIAIALLALGALTIERWLALSAALMVAFLALSLLVPAASAPTFHPTLVGTIALGIWFWREPRRRGSSRTDGASSRPGTATGS
ncbi:MAG TPA: serine/threonine-protein kinase [Kofleriaceae bacterium]|nr:serine/threonine-protein kinase [Kofleriaceae bacterium]